VRNGFEGLRVGDIAKDVGINKATLLYHFSDKEELIIALVDELVGRMRALNEGRNPVEIGSLAGFEAHMRILRELFSSAPEIYVAFNEIALRAIRDRRIARKLAAAERDWHDYVSSLLGAAAREGERDAVSALAYTSIVFVRGVAAKAAGDGTLATLLGRRDERKAAIEQLRQSFETFTELVRARLSSRRN
jgi:AcrR family transcriptional regulator